VGVGFTLTGKTRLRKTFNESSLYFFTRSGVLKNGEILFYENFYGFLFFL